MLLCAISCGLIDLRAEGEVRYDPGRYDWVLWISGKACGSQGRDVAIPPWVLDDPRIMVPQGHGGGVLGSMGVREMRGVSPKDVSAKGYDYYYSLHLSQ